MIFGNCSLSLAPVRKGTEERLAEFLSYVEAIPMEVLRTVEFDWETIPQYMEQLDNHLGINVGNLIGHTAVRHYVMGDDCQKPGATEEQIKAMQDVVRDGMAAGALGLSVSREKGHFDPQGVHIPALWADENEIFALCDVLREMGTGTIQAGGGQYVELKDGMMRRLAEATGRTVVYNSLSQTMRRPDEWKIHMARIEETAALGIRAYPMCSPNRVTQDFTMKNTQVFRGLPTWHPILLDVGRRKAAPLRRPRNPRQAARGSGRQQAGQRGRHLEDLVELHLGQRAGARKEQVDAVQVDRPDRRDAGQARHRRVPRPRRRGEARNPLPAGREQYRRRGADEDPDPSERGDRARRRRRARPVPRRLRLLTKLLGEWVREKQVMSLEQAVRRLTFDSASTFGLYDRGLLRPGMAADIVIFDPATVKCGKEEVVHDFPAGGWRIKETAEGVSHTIVNGQVLLEDKKHTGALPGRVLRNTYWHANHA